MDTLELLKEIAKLAGDAGNSNLTAKVTELRRAVLVLVEENNRWRGAVDRLRYGIENAMVPVSTHRQLLSVSWGDPEFRKSMEAALSNAVNQTKKILRDLPPLTPTAGV